MKKIVIGVLAVLALVSFVGCEKQKEEPIPNPVIERNEEQSQEQNQEMVENVVPPKMSNEEMYESVISDYKKALNEFDFEDMSEIEYDLVSEVLIMHVARYKTEGVELTYSFYDIDKNGIDELLVGASNSIGAIYSYNPATKEPVKIYFQDTLERGNLEIYDNGIILSSGAGGAALHYYEFGKISEDGASYEQIEYIEEEYLEGNETPIYRDNNTKEELAYKSLDEIMDVYVAGAEIVHAEEQ